MKLLGRANRTDQSLREAVDAAGGALDIRVSQLMRNHGFATPTPNATAHVEDALSRGGLRAVPPLPGLRWDESVRVVVNGVEQELEEPTAPEEIEQVMDESIALAQGEEAEEEATEVPETQVQAESQEADSATSALAVE